MWPGVQPELWFWAHLKKKIKIVNKKYWPYFFWLLKEQVRVGRSRGRVGGQGKGSSESGLEIGRGGYIECGGAQGGQERCEISGSCLSFFVGLSQFCTSILEGCNFRVLMSLGAFYTPIKAGISFNLLNFRSMVFQFCVQENVFEVKGPPRWLL